MYSYFGACELTDKTIYRAPDFKPSTATFIIKIFDEKHEPVIEVDFGVAINNEKMEIKKTDKNGNIKEYEPNIEKITLSLIGKHVSLDSHPPKKKNPPNENVPPKNKDENQEYEVRISTGDIEKAGTDSNVYIKFYGDKGETSETMLNPLIERNAFEKGNTDIVTLIEPDIGNLNRIKIWHDNKYPRSGWFLNKVIVINKKTGQPVEFPCYKWLSDDEGDKKICRTLKPDPLNPRPFYIIAHMCNATDYVDEAIRDGANAIECDITVEKNKNDILEFRVYHGTVFGVGYGRRGFRSTPIHEYLSYMRSNKDRFTIVIFDCKQQEEDISAREYGKKLCEIIKTYLPDNKCIMSIPKLEMRDFFQGMKDAGFDNAGKDISMIETSPKGKDPDLWINTAEETGANWLGMGIDARAPFSPLRNWIPPLVHSAQRRDKNEKVEKVYYWTLEDPSSMIRVLATDIDGIIINNPSTLKNLIEKEEFKHTFRLAINNDDPFVVFKQ